MMMATRLKPIATPSYLLRLPPQLWKDCPTGWVTSSLVQSGPSTLGPMAGRGLFAKADIPEGTVLGESVRSRPPPDHNSPPHHSNHQTRTTFHSPGSFPGVRYPKAEWITRKTGQEAALRSACYTWMLPAGYILDPTDADGNLLETLTGFGGIVRVPTLLALVNEPPPGVDTNLQTTIEKDKDVLFVAERGGCEDLLRTEWLVEGSKLICALLAAAVPRLVARHQQG